MQRFLVIFLIIYSSLDTIKIHAQTSGSGYVSSIEAKANQIQKNDEKVGELNRQHLNTYSEEQNKLNQLKSELAALIREKRDVLEELRQGRFCKGCDNTASQLRNKGIYDVEDHFRKNGGTYPAPPEKIKKAEEDFDRRIAAKQKVIDDFQSGENEFSRKRDNLSKQMNDLKALSDKLREEIQALSKQYKDAVFNEGKSMHKQWVSELLRILAEKHYIEDRINIMNVKLNDLAQEERKAIADLEAKLKKKNDEDIQQLNDKINLNKQNLISLEVNYKNRIVPVNTRLQGARNQLAKIKRDLLNKNLREEEIKKLQDAQAQQEALITESEATLQEYQASYNEQVQKVIGENKILSDKIWNLTINFSTLVQQESTKLKTAFESKRKIINDGIIARRTSLELTGKLLSRQETASTEKNNEYVRKVESERVRMLNACSKAGASCYGTDAASAVVANWNKSKACVGEFEGAHFSNDPVYGCEEESPMYLGHYRSWAGGISASDAEALKRAENKVRYDAIMNTIRN